MRAVALTLATAAVLLPLCAAAETANFQYDALGRLIQSRLDHGVVTSTSIGYDPAGNRSSLIVGISGAGGTSNAAFAIGNASGAPGQTLTFTVTESGTAEAPATVSFTTSNGSAVSGTDYSATSGTLSFAAGDTSKQVNVSTLSGSTGNKSFTVVLSNPTGGATISGSTATGTISAGAGPEVAATNPMLSLNSAQVTGLTLGQLATLNGHAATIASISPAAGNGSATIAGGGQTATYTAPTVAQAPQCQGATTISFGVPYTIRDSGNGIVVGGSMSVSVTGAPGPSPKPPAVCNRPTPVADGAAAGPSSSTGAAGSTSSVIQTTGTVAPTGPVPGGAAIIQAMTKYKKSGT